MSDLAKRTHLDHVKRRMRFQRAHLDYLREKQKTAEQPVSYVETVVRAHAKKVRAHNQALVAEANQAVVNSKSGLLKYRAKRIVSFVASKFQVSADDIMFYWRTPRTDRARQIAQYLITDWLGMTQAACSRLFERDHTSILHSQKQIRTLRASDSEFDAQITKWIRELEEENASQVGMRDTKTGFSSGECAAQEESVTA